MTRLLLNNRCGFTRVIIQEKTRWNPEFTDFDPAITLIFFSVIEIEKLFRPMNVIVISVGKRNHIKIVAPLLLESFPKSFVQFDTTVCRQKKWDREGSLRR